MACAHPGMPVDGEDTHKKQKRRPHRPCRLCIDGKLQSALTRHIKMYTKLNPPL